MLREKVVAAAATRMIAIADAGKSVARLGARPVPIEVLPFARAAVERQVARLGAGPGLRPGTSDQGNFLIDCLFGSIPDPARLAADLSAIPGMLGMACSWTRSTHFTGALPMGSSPAKESLP